MHRFLRVLARNTSQLPVNLSLPVCRFSSRADLLHNVTSQRPRLYTIATIYMLTTCGDFTLVLTLPPCPIQLQAFAPAASRRENKFIRYSWWLFSAVSTTPHVPI